MATMKEQGALHTNDLELLFSLELNYQGQIELAPIGDKVGTLVGGGDGRSPVRGCAAPSGGRTTRRPVKTWSAPCKFQVLFRQMMAPR